MMNALKKLKLDVEALRVDSFDSVQQARGTGTVNGHGLLGWSLPCSGSCTPAGSCFDGCYTDSAARPYCY